MFSSFLKGGPVRPQNAPPPAPGSEYSQGLQQGGYVTDSEGNTLKYIEKGIANFFFELILMVISECEGGIVGSYVVDMVFALGSIALGKNHK